jgi:hypothetical protein
MYDSRFLEIGWADSLVVFFKVVANNPGSVYVEGFFKNFSNFSGVGQKTFKKFQKFQLFFKHFFTFRSKHQKNAFQRILRRRKNFALQKPSPGLCQNFHIFQTCSKSQHVVTEPCVLKAG